MGTTEDAEHTEKEEAKHGCSAIQAIDSDLGMSILFIPSVYSHFSVVLSLQALVIRCDDALGTTEDAEYAEKEEAKHGCGAIQAIDSDLGVSVLFLPSVYSSCSVVLCLESFAPMVSRSWLQN